MIAVPPGVRVLIWSQPVDFRAGMDRLAALVQLTLRQDPFAGDVYVFRSRRGDRVKLLVFDGTGLVLVTKRLERGRFLWPPMSGGADERRHRAVVGRAAVGAAGRPAVGTAPVAAGAAATGGLLSKKL